MADDETWTRRFLLLAGVNALIAVGWIVPLFVDQRISRTIAGGSVGTWGVLGFLLWICVGCLGVVGFAAAYHVTPKIADGALHDGLAWANLALTEVGALGATAILGVAGYIGGTTLLEAQQSGVPPGEAAGQVHQAIAWAVEPVPWVAVLAAVAAIGVAVGVVNHLQALTASDPGAR